MDNKDKKFRMTPHKLMIALFAAITLSIPVTSAILPKKERSENENRALAKLPQIVNQSRLNKAENLSDVIKAIRWDEIYVDRSGPEKIPTIMDKMETYLADHIVGRDEWVRAKNTMETVIGKKEINGVYTLDNQLIQAFKGYDKEQVQKSISAMNKFAEKHPDIQCSLMIAPTAQELFNSEIPTYTGYLSEKSFIEECYKNVRGISTIDCLSFLTGHKNDYVFYRTDHHWTSQGAYYAYCAAAKTLGYSSFGTESFNIETASSSFRGTLYSKTLDNSITPDIISYYHLASGSPQIKMTVNDGKDVKVYDSLYVRSFLETKDKYSGFTGSNAPLVTIETDIDNGKNLLLIKDSYAHSLVPFLANHYSKITMVDMRYISTDLNQLVNISEYQQAMFMFNAISFSEDIHLPKLALTR